MVGLRCDPKCLGKRKAERDLTTKEGDNVVSEAEGDRHVMWGHKPRTENGLCKTENGQEWILPLNLQKESTQPTP